MEGTFNSEKYLDEAIGNLERTTGRDEVVSIPVGKICPNRLQPRKYFDPKALKELETSIRENGLLQPILVRKIEEPGSEFMFELIAGERRWRASIAAGLSTIAAIVKKDVTDRQLRTFACIENMHRDDLNPLEKAASIAGIKEDYGDDDSVAKVLGYNNKKTVTRYLKIHTASNLTPEINKIFWDNTPALDFKTASEFSELSFSLAKLKKSNNREYRRIIRRLEKKGIKDSISYLTKYFAVPETKTTPAAAAVPEMFRETNNEYVLKIKVNKDKKLTFELRKNIQENINQFLEKIDTLKAELQPE
ncbi:MAG: ParB/RepB/Spo0J family partition protein [Nitrospirota bacterium]|nr:ParB/RepB/Spo0J family partition protein [Nitrospirota bacterium]